MCSPASELWVACCKFCSMNTITLLSWKSGTAPAVPVVPAPTALENYRLKFTGKVVHLLNFAVVCFNSGYSWVTSIQQLIGFVVDTLFKAHSNDLQWHFSDKYHFRFWLENANSTQEMPSEELYSYVDVDSNEISFSFHQQWDLCNNASGLKVKNTLCFNELVKHSLK